MSAFDRFTKLLNEMQDLIYAPRVGDQVDVRHIMAMGSKLNEIQQAAYDMARERRDAALRGGKIPVGPATRLVDHPNTNGESKLLADLGVRS